MNTTRGFALGLSLACLGMLAPVQATVAEDSGLRGVFVSETKADAEIGKAIEAAVAKMNFITRPIARGRLKKTNPAYRRVEIVSTVGEFSVKFDDRVAVQAPLNGKSIKWVREDGEKFDVTASQQASEQESRILQTFKSNDGQRSNRFSLSPDRNTLTIEVTIESEQLPEPVRYNMIFLRRSQ